MIKAGKSFLKAFISTVFAITLAIASIVTVCAEIDASRTGSITLTIVSSETGDTVSGGSIAVYRVASVDNNGVYTLESDFSSLGIDFNALTEVDPLMKEDQKLAPTSKSHSGKSVETSWSEAAKNVAIYVRNHALEDKMNLVAIDRRGVGKMTDVETGLYVAVQNEASRKNEVISPFVILLPYYDGSELHYDLTARPKADIIPRESAALTLPVVTKTVGNTDAKLDTEFRFSFKALEEGYPDIVNSSGAVEIGGNVVSQTTDEIIVRTIGAGSAEIGSITFTEPGDYYFEATEVNTMEPGFKYDPTVYWCKYSIRYNENDNTDLILSNITIKHDDANGKALYEGADPTAFSFDFVNYVTDKTVEPTAPESTVKPSEVPPAPTQNNSKNTPKDSSLPQTGQIWWPVIVLAIAGSALIISGAAISSRKKKKHNGK